MDLATSKLIVCNGPILCLTTPQLEDLNKLLRCFKSREESIEKLFSSLLFCKSSATHCNKIYLHNLNEKLSKNEEGLVKTEDFIINKYAQSIFSEIKQRT